MILFHFVNCFRFKYRNDLSSSKQGEKEKGEGREQKRNLSCLKFDSNILCYLVKYLI